MKSPVKIGTKFTNFLVVFIVMFMANCRSNKNDPTANYPVLGPVALSEIKATSARAACAITKVGFGADAINTIKEYGICYAAKENPSISDTKLKAGDKTDKPLDFSVFISGLTANTKYYIRGYVLHEGDPVYSEQAVLTTSAQKAPDAATGSAENITGSAFGIAGKITDIGTGDVTQHGHVLSETNQTPTLADTKTELGTANAPKDFKSVFIGLKANTAYYVRAYATNATGTGYGAVVSVKTANVVPPTVTTGNVSNITTSSADVGVTRTALGTIANGQVGVCWSSTNQNPTIADSKRENGSAAAPEFFSINLANLTSNTTYYVRGYATTTAGTGYGDVKSFKTAAVAILPPTINAVSQPAKNYCSGYLADWAGRTIDFTKTFDGYCSVSGYSNNDSYGMPPSVIVSFSYVPSNDEIQSIGICVKKPNDGFVLPGTVDAPTINNDKVDNNSKGITWRNNQFTGIFNYVTMTTADVSCLGKRFYSYYFIKPYNNGIVANKLLLTYIYRPYIIGKSGNVYYGEAKTYTILTEDSPYCGTPSVK